MGEMKDMERARYPWTYDDLILVLDFYFTSGFPKSRIQPEFLDLANLAQPHPPQSTLAQIRNFEFLDPRGAGGGLEHVSPNARRIWDEFVNDRRRLKNEARKIKINRLANRRAP